MYMIIEMISGWDSGNGGGGDDCNGENVSDIEEGYDIMAVVAMKTTAIAELHLIM